MLITLPSMRGTTMVERWAWSMRRRNLAASTIEKRLSVARRLSAHAGVPLEQVTAADIEAWIDSRPNTARTRYTDISHVSAFFTWAIRYGELDHDPTGTIERPKVRPGLPRPISRDDLRLVLRQAVEPDLSAMLYLAAFGGLRCAEIAGLYAEDINGDMMLIHGKGGRQRVIPLHPLAAAAINATRPSSYGPLFDERPWRVSHRICGHLRDCGVHATAHQLRHYFATAVYEASGGDLRMTQELLGHSSPTTTAVYTQWAHSRAVEVVAKMTA